MHSIKNKSLPILYHIWKIILTVVLILAFFLPGSVYADEAGDGEIPARVSSGGLSEGYELKDYDVDVTVNRNHTYNVDLRLTVNIPQNFSRLDVLLPNGNFRVSDIQADADHEIVSDGDVRRIVITSPYGQDAIPEGEHTYEITYLVTEFAEYNDAYDIFFYDAVEPDWNVPINDFRIRLHFPEDFDWSDLQYYAGQFGIQDQEREFRLRTSGNTVTLTGSKLPQNYGITFKAQLPDGYWEGALDNRWTQNAALILMLGIFLLIFLFWLIGGRDPRVPKKDERRPLPDVSPVEIGYLFNGRIRIRDVIILLIDFAVSGNLRIVEYKPKKYKLVRLREPSEKSRYLRSAYNTLFEDVYQGRALEMEDIGGRLLRIRGSLEADIESGYSAKEMRACTPFSVILRYASMVILALGIGLCYLLAEMYAYRDGGYSQAIILSILAFLALVLVNWRYDSRFEEEPVNWSVTLGASLILFGAVLGYSVYAMGVSSGKGWASVLLFALGIGAMILTLFMKARAKGNAEMISRVRSLRSFMNAATIRELAPLIVEGEKDDSYYREMIPYALLFNQEEAWARKFSWLRAESPYYFETEIDGSAHAADTASKDLETIARDVRTFIRTIENEYHTMNRKRRIR